MSWERPMLTDSGGFQVFSLSGLRKVTPEGVEFRSHLDGSKHFFSPEHSMDVQIALGADIAMVFDECVETPATWERTRESMGLTHAWAQRSKDHFEANSILFRGSQRRMGRRRTCLGSCRAECMSICGRSLRSGWWRWIFRDMRLADWLSASRAR